jgi:hypothetical protein
MAESAVIRFGRVTNVNDPHGGGRIQVRTTFDNPIEHDEDLPYYIPLLPKMLHIMPKVGEMVLVFSMAAGEFNNFNYYIGPLISQEDKLFYEDADASLRLTETGYIGWGPNPRLKKGVKPTLYPASEDIAIEGRKDTGIQLKDEEVRIKAGVKVVDYRGPKNNTKTPAFISLKYYPKNDYEKDGFMSTATIVADKINLIGTHTTDPATKEIPVTENKDMSAEDKDNLISDSAMKELLNKAHQIPYGDKLIEFLDILRVAFAKHVHPFPTMAPCNDENMKAVATYDLEGTLSDNVRIN